jgi:hypothetical protein
MVRVGQASVVIAKGNSQSIGSSLLGFMGTVIDADFTWLSRSSPKSMLRTEIAALRRR